MPGGSSNQQFILSVITELIVGYMMPGRPLAMMLFKTFGYITMAQALTFSSDMKLGHYMKVGLTVKLVGHRLTFVQIPPVPMFWAQVVATVMAGTVQLGVQVRTLFQGNLSNT